MLLLNDHYHHYEIFNMSLAKRLRMVRESKGLNQLELAKAVGLTQQAIQAIESGLTKQPRGLRKIADVLGVDEVWLQHGIENVNKTPSQIKLASFDQIGYKLVPYLSNKDLLDLISNKKNISDFPRTMPVMTNFVDIDDSTFFYEISNNAMKCSENDEKSLIRGEIAIVKYVEKKEPIIGDLVLVHIPPEDFLIRELTQEGSAFILETYNKQYPIMKFEDNFKIVGTVVATQRIKKH